MEQIQRISWPRPNSCLQHKEARVSRELVLVAEREGDGTYMVVFAALTSRMTLALAVGSLRPVSLRVKTVFSLGFTSSSGAASAAAAAPAAPPADGAGIAISVMFNRVFRCCTRSAASSSVNFSIWSTIPLILGSTDADDDEEAALARVDVVEMRRSDVRDAELVAALERDSKSALDEEATVLRREAIMTKTLDRLQYVVETRARCKTDEAVKQGWWSGWLDRCQRPIFAFSFSISSCLSRVTKSYRTK